MPTESPDAFVRRVTKRIAELRRDRGMTQEGLAEALCTATRNVQRIEAGQNLTLHTLARVAALLGVRPEELVTGEIDAPRARRSRRP